jgi:rubrerythrin
LYGGSEVALHTASAIISFYSRLEDQTAKFYSDVAENEKYSDGRKTFLAFAQENKKQKAMIRRTYQEVITDALEACFSFPNLHEDAYQINSELTDTLSYAEVLEKAITIEEKSYKFCTEASEKSKDLLAGIPHAFNRVAKRKAKRMLLLKSLLDTEGTSTERME